METLPSVTGIEHYMDPVDSTSTRCACISHHSLVQKTHLILFIIFLSNLSSPTCYLSSTKKTSTLHIPARMLRTLWYQNPTAPTVVRLPSTEDPQETKWHYPTASPLIREKGPTISHAERPSACIASRLLRRPGKSTFKHLILTTPLCQHHVLSMSMITGITELTDTECERGQVTSWPPVPYTKSKAGLVLQASRDTIKLKTSEGEFKQNLLGNNPDP